jgi:hypothetical protein
MYKLREIVIEAKMTESDKDEIKKQLAFLRYGRQWAFNSKTLVDAFTFMSGSDELPDWLPIGPLAFFSQDRVELVMSCFGRFCPTLLFPSAPRYDLTKSNRPTTVQAHQVPYSQAVQDMKLILSNKYVTVPNDRRRSGPYKAMIFRGSDARDIFSAVTKYAVGHVVVESAPQVVVGSSNSEEANLFEF